MDSKGNTVVNDSGATIVFTGTATNQSATVGVQLTNTGTITSNKGTLSISALTNLNGTGTLTGGTYTASGGVLSVPRNVVHNAATINLGASPSAINSGGGNALTGMTSNTGTLDLKASLALTGAMANSGTLTVEAGTFHVESVHAECGYDHGAGRGHPEVGDRNEQHRHQRRHADGHWRPAGEPHRCWQGRAERHGGRSVDGLGDV